LAVSRNRDPDEVSLCDTTQLNKEAPFDREHGDWLRRPQSIATQHLTRSGECRLVKEDADLLYHRRRTQANGRDVQLVKQPAQRLCDLQEACRPVHLAIVDTLGVNSLEHASRGYHTLFAYFHIRNSGRLRVSGDQLLHDPGMRSELVRSRRIAVCREPNHRVRAAN